MTDQFKEGREKCYSARDLYWKCIDTGDEKKCKKLREEFENCCPKQWVKHFDRKRKYEKFKDDLNNVGWTMPSKEDK